MNGGVSIVICCHNSAKRLPETLRHLAAQRVPADIPWEVVVIDNASTDDTAATALRCWPASIGAPLRIANEPKLGLANARFRSYSEARHEFISFIDDDNRVGPDWVANVAHFFRDHPAAVAVGGPSRGIFEAEPPPWFADIAAYYAIGDQHAVSGDITDQPGTLLWGAGLSVRRARGLELLEGDFRILLCGGDDLNIRTSEDTELCFALRALGGRLYYEPKMAIEHFMPADRLTWPKTLKLMRTMGESSPLLQLYLFALDAPPVRGVPAWKKTWLFLVLKNLNRWIQLLLLHPGDCLRQPEGSSAAMEAERCKGALSTLWLLRGKYGAMGNRIRNAPWVQRSRKAAAPPL